MFSHKRVRGTPCKQHPPSWASAEGPCSLTHLLRVSRNERRNISIHNPIQSGPVVEGCMWHQQQAPAILWGLQTSIGTDVWAIFASFSETPVNVRKESLASCSHPITTSQSAEISSPMLSLPFSNIKGLDRIYSELQHSWSPPSGQRCQEERHIRRCWFL